MKNIFVSSGIFSPGISLQEYRKIPKISPGAYIFQRPFLRGLFLEGLIFGGAYVRREICVSKLVVGRKFIIFALYSRANSMYKPPGVLIFGGAI